MTILNGQITKAEGAYELIEALDITPIELFETLSEEQQEQIVAEFNNICDDFDEEPVNGVTDFPQFVYDEWNEWISREVQSIPGLVIEVMEQREQEYIHVTNQGMGTRFHTVIEVHN